MATENDEDMEYLLEEYIQTKGQIESGKKELTLNEVKYISMFNHVRTVPKHSSWQEPNARILSSWT